MRLYITRPTRKRPRPTGLEGLYTPFRQGRPLSLPTLPFQKINRYAVDGSMQMLFLLQTHINHTNRYAVVSAKQAFITKQLYANERPCALMPLSFYLAIYKLI